MSIIGKKEVEILKDGLWYKNPVTFQVLGICSSLAVTVKVETALLMALGMTFVTAFSNLVISFMRDLIPSRIRIIIQLTVVSVLVIIADQLMKAYAFDVSKQLSVFVGLIITNCIVMGRLEAYAMSNPPWRSFLDGLGNALGYSCVLIVVSMIREVLGSGTILGFHVIPEAFYSAGYINNGIMVLAPGAFFLLGIIIWIQRSISKYVEQ